MDHLLVFDLVRRRINIESTWALRMETRGSLERQPRPRGSGPILHRFSEEFRGFMTLQEANSCFFLLLFSVVPYMFSENVPF